MWLLNKGLHKLSSYNWSIIPQFLKICIFQLFFIILSSCYLTFLTVWFIRSGLETNLIQVQTSNRQKNFLNLTFVSFYIVHLHLWKWLASNCLFSGSCREPTSNKKKSKMFGKSHFLDWNKKVICMIFYDYFAKW